MPRRTRVVSTALGLVMAAVPATVLVSVSPAEAAKAKTFKNCTALNKRYPHGVGKPGARDRTSGKPVTTFTRNAKLYRANKKSDRDKDGIACEKA